MRGSRLNVDWERHSSQDSHDRSLVRFRLFYRKRELETVQLKAMREMLNDIMIGLA